MERKIRVVEDESEIVVYADTTIIGSILKLKNKQVVLDKDGNELSSFMLNLGENKMLQRAILETQSKIHIAMILSIFDVMAKV